MTKVEMDLCRQAVDAAVDGALGEVVRQLGDIGQVAVEARNAGMLAARPWTTPISTLIDNSSIGEGVRKVRDGTFDRKMIDAEVAEHAIKLRLETVSVAAIEAAVGGNELRPHEIVERLPTDARGRKLSEYIVSYALDAMVDRKLLVRRRKPYGTLYKRP